jgi:hypothetical protein
MKAEAQKTLVSFAIELVLYAVLIAIYFLLVLHLLGPSLGDLAKNHIRLYALLSVGLILGQSIALEWVTTSILRLLRGRSE